MRRAALYVRVTFVVGYNDDKKDLEMGGDTVLGPYFIVLKDEQKKFIKEISAHIKKIGRADKIQQIVVDREVLLPIEGRSRGDKMIEWACEYLNDQNNWIF